MQKLCQNGVGGNGANRRFYTHMVSNGDKKKRVHQKGNNWHFEIIDRLIA